jgi:hypothetical protein
MVASEHKDSVCKDTETICNDYPSCCECDFCDSHPYDAWGPNTMEFVQRRMPRLLPQQTLFFSELISLPPSWIRSAYRKCRHSPVYEPVKDRQSIFDVKLDREQNLDLWNILSSQDPACSGRISKNSFRAAILNRCSMKTDLDHIVHRYETDNGIDYVSFLKDFVPYKSPNKIE